MKSSGGVSFASRSFFLALTIFACFGVSPVWSDSEEEYAGWFTKNDAQSADGSFSESHLPPPPGVRSSQQKLQKCIFDNFLAIEEEEKIVLLNETLVVDGCLLECGDKMLHSTVSEGSIVTVRNGGHVKDCSIVLIKENYLKEELNAIDRLDNIDDAGDGAETTRGTTSPTVWDTYSSTAAPWVTRFVPNPVAGFLCDQGDCVLEDSNCSPLEQYSDVPSKSILMMRECVLVEAGAADVRVKGGLVTSKDRPVSHRGIVVDAGFNPKKHSIPEEDHYNATARLFVDDVIIRNQLRSGIIIVGGANTVRIRDSAINSNAYHGIYVSNGYGLENFAIFGVSIENNAQCGINMASYQLPGTNLPISTEMFVSDVLLKNNGEDGLKVMRIDNIAIDGVIADKNLFNGIDIRDARTVLLQGVVCKNNARNGLSVEAEDSTVDISNSVFLTNGHDFHSAHWKRAGVYMWLPKRATITNSVSNGNSMDGILIYDVSHLNFVDVDVMSNGNDGIEIRETNALYGHDYTANSDYLVGAYYYPWHGDDFHNGGGYLREELTPPQMPKLGEYDDSDPEVISQHLEWFRKSNIGLLVVSWWGPNRLEDSNTLNVLMEHDYIGNLKIALHYETTNRVKEEAGNDMSGVESDIEYMCENYFNHPNYYKVDGRPVLVIYISRKLERLGKLELVVSTMRSAAGKCGHNIYLIGDSVFSKAPDVDDENPFLSFRYLDAVTNYDLYGSMGAPKQDSPYAGAEAVDNFYAEQEEWRKLALEEDCRFIPPVSPGYNDRAVRMIKDNPPLSRRLTASSEEGSLFKYQLEKALPLVDPEVDNLILINSFNEWHEDTQIEPVKGVERTTDSREEDGIFSTEPEEFTFGLEYVGYGELYLDILRNATSRPGAETKNLERTYKPSYVDFTDVRSCSNGVNGMRFYVTENSFDDQTEFVFNPGPGIVSCDNEITDYAMYGGGNVDFVTSPNNGIVGDSCANGKHTFGCGFQNLMKSCEKRYCRHRNIVTTSGVVINDHKIQ
jgi:hypothetical protein